MALPEGQEWRLPPAYENHPLFVQQRSRRSPSQWAGKSPLQPPPAAPPSPSSNGEESSVVLSSEGSTDGGSDSDCRADPRVSEESSADGGSESDCNGDPRVSEESSAERGSDSDGSADQRRSEQNLTMDEKRQLLKLRIRLPLSTCYVVSRGEKRRQPPGAGEQQPTASAGAAGSEDGWPETKRRTEARPPVTLRLRVREAYGADDDGFFVEPRRCVALEQHIARRERRRHELAKACRKRRRPRGATEAAGGRRRAERWRPGATVDGGSERAGAVHCGRKTTAGPGISTMLRSVRVERMLGR